MGVLRMPTMAEPKSDFFREGGPGFVYGSGKKPDSIGIGPVHPEWTILDGYQKRPLDFPLY